MQVQMQKYLNTLDSIRDDWQAATDTYRSQYAALYRDDGVMVYAPATHQEKLTALQSQLQSKADQTNAAIGRVEEGVKAELQNGEIDPLLRLSSPDELDELNRKERRIHDAVDVANLVEVARLLQLRHTPVERLLYIEATERKLAALPVDGDRNGYSEERRGYLEALHALDELKAPATERRRKLEQTSKEVIESAGRLRVRVNSTKFDLLRVGERSRTMRQF